jgi:hypothetical protein
VGIVIRLDNKDLLVVVHLMRHKPTVLLRLVLPTKLAAEMLVLLLAQEMKTKLPPYMEPFLVGAKVWLIDIQCKPILEGSLQQKAMLNALDLF